MLFFSRRPALSGAQAECDALRECHPHMPASWSLPTAPTRAMSPKAYAAPPFARGGVHSMRGFKSSSRRPFSSCGYQHFIPQWQSRESFDKSSVEVAKCSGVYIHDADGHKLFDMMSQIMAVNLGHNLHDADGHNIYERAITKQLNEVPFLNTIKFTHPVLDSYTAQLSNTLPDNLNKIFFTVSGAEANETAIKVARTVTGKSKVLYRNRSYHGASYGTLSVSGDARKAMLGLSHMPNAIQIPHTADLEQQAGVDATTQYLEAVEAVIQKEGPQTIAAMLLETMTGGSGMYPPPAGTMAGLRKLCDEHGILMITDEAVTGFGRTGTMWAFEQEGFTPDMITLAKGITK